MSFHLFVYGTLRRDQAPPGLMAGCRRVTDAYVRGTLYDIDGEYPALLLYGSAPVAGEVWRCPPEHLPALDQYEGVADSLFRRVATTASGTDGVEYPCWIYTAGPALAHRLTLERRIDPDPDARAG